MKHSLLMLAIVFIWTVWSQAIYNSFPGEEALANAVAFAESSHREWVINPNGEYSVGLFQINLNAHYPHIPGSTWAEKTAWLQNGYNNIWYAKQLRDRNGWQPWGAYTSGRYWQYL